MLTFNKGLFSHFKLIYSKNMQISVLENANSQELTMVFGSRTHERSVKHVIVTIPRESGSQELDSEDIETHE